ncbi:acetyl esterase/lipase [Sphingomonas jejuensis]|uniref:Acetyl esterase/lipase n=1 Tax=Sphingomonas jejuensis TaxID=904715 RepID=A0ABX0XQC8_9SPHN|nr:alpha/beta hydrolase [Sphingomonas jejuensis]NJC34922.1 acetyl esterase/lipase [Sphingomonas jejuensis]
MRGTVVLLSVALCAAGPSIAAAQDSAPTPLSTMERRSEALPPPTETVRYGAEQIQSGELRLPPGNGPFPVAIVIHGGCWNTAISDHSAMPGLSEMLRRRGVATWDIDYRRVGNAGGGWPGTFQDIAAGVDHLATLATRHPLDLARVTVVGHSAGAHLALWAASRHRLPAPWTPGPASPHLRSVVAIDGPGTLAPLVGADAQVCGRPVIVPLMGGTPAERPAEYRIASPSDHLPLGLPQLLVLAELAPFMTGYVEAARAAGDPVRTLAPDNANHFDIVTPGMPNGERVADWIAAEAFRTR